MTWGEFKKFLEENGVTDETAFFRLDYTEGESLELIFGADGKFNVTGSSARKHYVQPAAERWYERER